MNKSTVSPVLWLVFSFMLAISAFAGSVKPTPSPIAEVKVSPTRVDWALAVEAERWVLTVAGPGDFFLRQPFEAGRTPFLGLSDSEGNRLPDGSYAWELRGVPQIETESPETPPKPRGAGGLSNVKQHQRGQLVASGRLSVAEEGFVAPGGTGAEGPEPPLHNVFEKDSLLTGRFSNDGNGCIGDECNSLNDPDFSAFKIRSTLPHLYFDDVELPCEGCPTGSPHDWAVFINQSNTDQLAISEFVDGTLTSTPFTLRGGAPDNSLFVSSAGNVGLGTSSPTKRLTIKGAAGNNDIVQVVKSSGSTTIFRIFETTNGDGLVSLFDSTGAETFRLTSVLGGKLSIGCNSPEHDLDLSSLGGGACSGGGSRSFIDAGSTTFTTSSSRSIKENLAPVQIANILDKISGVGVYNYDFIDGPKDKMGLIAEDFHTVFARGSDKLINGQEVEMALWLGVQELTSQNKELSAENKDLRAQNQEITKRLAALEARLAVEPVSSP